MKTGAAGGRHENGLRWTTIDATAKYAPHIEPLFQDQSIMSNAAMSLLSTSSQARNREMQTCSIPMRERRKGIELPTTALKPSLCVNVPNLSSRYRYPPPLRGRYVEVCRTERKGTVQYCAVQNCTGQAETVCPGATYSRARYSTILYRTLTSSRHVATQHLKSKSLVIREITES